MIDTQVLLNGLVLGALYACIAVGFSLVWGVLNIINLLHGSLIVLGAYLALLAFTYAGLHPFMSLLPVAVAMFGFAPLILRALFFGPWRVGRVVLEGRWSRAGVTAALGLLCLLAALGSIWASYGFTARTAPDPGVRLSFSGITRSAAVQESRARLPDLPPTEMAEPVSSLSPSPGRLDLSTDGYQ